ncbi:MAG: alpha/beta fold hydrolase [Haloferacaceae archaeon]
MFDGFDDRRVALDDATIHVRTAGDGPPLLLLHGYPQTGAAWARVAPDLADEFSVVVPDLRGYGASEGPADPSAVDYAKRTLAHDAVGLMAELGHDRFALAGHDRGARVGYRLALDYPDRVERLAVLDVTPTLSKAEAMDWQAAKSTFHWLFLAQPRPLPETLIRGDPDFFLEFLLDSWAGDRSALDPAAVTAYRDAFRRDRVIRATCEDYRAGLSHDVDHDRESRAAGERIDAPLLALWGAAGRTASADPLGVWERWATDVRGGPVDCGHFVMEEAPAETTDRLRGFFR